MDQREEQRLRLREEPAPADGLLVIRGAPLTVAKLQIHARRTHRAWALDGRPLYGLSVFCALDDIGPASAKGLLAGRLDSYRRVHDCCVQRLSAEGFTLLATGHRPHFTIQLSGDGEAELRRMIACFGPPKDNRHYWTASTRRKEGPHGRR